MKRGERFAQAFAPLLNKIDKIEKRQMSGEKAQAVNEKEAVANTCVRVHV